VKDENKLLRYVLTGLCVALPLGFLVAGIYWASKKKAEGKKNKGE